MRPVRLGIPLAALIFLAIFCLQPPLCADSAVSYQLLDSLEGSTYYRLNVAVSQSLYDYYAGKTHRLSSYMDYDKLVTPYALRPITDCLQEIYADDEGLANGALMIVHQIPYEVTGPVRYPVETIVANKGDCDLFSTGAASILKAGSIDVVLLYYEDEAHMNIGVGLSQPPQNARTRAYYVTYNNVRYYIAECTGEDWQNGWRVGECPEELRDATPKVVPLEDFEQEAFGQVSASYKTLMPSTLSLAASPMFLIEKGTITLSGQLSTAQADATITFYVSVNNSPWRVVGTTSTDSAGRFTYYWDTDVSGICSIRASWSGNENYAGADSSVLTITVLSLLFVILIAAVGVLAIVGLATFIMSKRAPQGVPEPQAPEISY
ncbi:Ig-like domain repeat protein [Candidatus Bathyarchaeota archaeon]|nr:Ig-like domain repeat protein [Candidatus Bathyarchaeota archaeon]